MTHDTRTRMIQCAALLVGTHGAKSASLRDLAREGMTMLVVTHEMGFARDASDRVIFLHEGRIEEDGTATQVFGAPSSERCQRFISSALG